MKVIPLLLASLIAPSPALASAPQLLSAFFGADDVAGVGGPRSGCGLGGAYDGMPLVVSQQIQGDVNGLLDPTAFAVIGPDGTSTGRTVVCASLLPANEENEDTTILLVGELGTLGDEPVAVTIVGDVLTEAIDPNTNAPYNLRGASVAVTELAAGPSLVLARWLPEAEWERGRGDCPAQTLSIVQLTFAGGVLSIDGDELGVDTTDYARFSVAYASGAIATPFAFGDLNDNDNIVELCLSTAAASGHAYVIEDTVIDPIGDANPATDAAISAEGVVGE